MKICIVEDDAVLQKTLSQFLSKKGYFCDTASSFSKARTLNNLYTYDCFVVDMRLPDGNGTDLIPLIAEKQNNVGIIMISGSANLEDKIQSLELGADDFLMKPFPLQELNARLRTVLRRKKFGGNFTLEFNELKLFPDDNKLKVNGQEVYLTEREYKVLEFFVMNKYQVISKEDLSEQLWENPGTGDKPFYIYTHIKNLRKKLKQAACNDYLKTVHSIGYKFTDH